MRTQGENRTEAMNNIREAIELYVEDCRDAGEPDSHRSGQGVRRGGGRVRGA